MADLVFFPFTVPLGTRIRVVRISRGWRQTDLAREALVSQAEVSALERGKYVCAVSECRILNRLGLVGDAVSYYRARIGKLPRNSKTRCQFERRLQYLQGEMREVRLG